MLCFSKILSIHSPVLTSHFSEKERFNHLHLWVNCFCHLMENPLRKQIMEMASTNDYRLLWFHSEGRCQESWPKATLLATGHSSHCAHVYFLKCIIMSLEQPQMRNSGTDSTAAKYLPGCDSGKFPFFPDLYPIKLQTLLGISPVIS